MSLLLHRLVPEVHMLRSVIFVRPRNLASLSYGAFPHRVILKCCKVLGKMLLTQICQAWSPAKSSATFLPLDQKAFGLENGKPTDTATSCSTRPAWGAVRKLQRTTDGPGRSFTKTPMKQRYWLKIYATTSVVSACKKAQAVQTLSTQAHRPVRSFARPCLFTCNRNRC